jgi:ATP/maltotriose-dependent transcriptional regulator MalT
MALASARSHKRSHAPSRFVSRPRLVQKLSAVLQGRVSLVVAAAGFGKTTMLVETL